MNKEKKKILIKILLFILTLILIVNILNVALTIGLKKMLRDDLTKIVDKSTEGLYALNTGNLHINLLSGFVSVEDISLDINQDRLSELYYMDSLPRYYGSIKIKELSFDGLDFRYRKNPQKRKFFLKRITIDRPEFIVIDNKNGIQTDNPKENVVKVKNKTPYQMIAPYFDFLSISEIKLKEGVVNFYLENDKDTTAVILQHINMKAQGFKIDSLSEKRSHFLYSNDFHLFIDTAQVRLPDKLYTLNTGKVELSISDSLLRISDIAYISNIPKWEFAFHDPKHTDWMDVKVGSFELKGMHIQEYIENKEILLDSIFVSDVFFQNYKNQKIPITHNIMPLIYEPVQKFPVPFAVNYVKASNINIIYEELDKKGVTPGFINFTQMEGVFDEGVTNILEYHTQTNKLKATGKLMGEGLINAELYFPVDTTYDCTRIRGTLGTMDMISLNRIIEPMMPARIKSGFIQGMDFNIEGGKEKAHIDMCLRYNDFSVDILLPMGEKHRSSQFFLSFLVNGIIEKNNPSSDGELRRIQTDHIRDPYHSSFNYLWKIYMAGLVETMGFTKERQRNVEWIKENLQK